MAFAYQPCDSYFVECHGVSEQIAQEEARQYKKQYDRQQQIYMAEELCHMAKLEYEEDFRIYMEQMEVSVSVSPL